MTWADRVNIALEARNKRPADLIRESGWPKSRVMSWLSGRVLQPNQLDEVISRIAELLNVSPVWIRDGSGEMDDNTAIVTAPSGKPDLQAGYRKVDVNLPNPMEMPKNVPVRGAAAGARDDNGAMQFDDSIVDYVRRPPGLAQVQDAYAVYVVGDSMWPRYPQGDLLYCHPRRPPSPGCDVVIQIQRGEHEPIEGFVKTFVSQTASEIVVSQFNPEKEFRFAKAEVVAIHRILGLNELMGI